jgi:outer membrane protein assembly factor BamB
MSGFRGNQLRAVRLAEAKGDITSSGAQVWTLDRDTPYVPSPLLYDGVVYFLKTNSGLLSAFDAKTGKPHYQLQRLDGVPNVFASPVGAKGRVYLTGQEGTTLVIKHGPAYSVIAKNVLDDGFNASPALVDGEIYLRGFKYLYSIGER